MLAASASGKWLSAYGGVSWPSKSAPHQRSGISGSIESLCVSSINIIGENNIGISTISAGVAAA